ncbi:ADP-ribosylglycohydrolase family protein [Amycolatopsis sacchari]|uniref:ADP-ribosylglycohydrolase family protein n=1 Tax=Amycolatopsis sacchari TaxID=115433 RepID=UPI003EBAF743
MPRMGFSITAGQRLACVTLGVKGSQAKPGVPWFGNFFDGWTNAGGNGAAMRIQPHVWAAKSLTSPDQYWSDIFLDSINTHGNPRAIAGALLHGQYR